MKIYRRPPLDKASRKKQEGFPTDLSRIDVLNRPSGTGKTASSKDGGGALPTISGGMTNTSAISTNANSGLNFEQEETVDTHAEIADLMANPEKGKVQNKEVGFDAEDIFNDMNKKNVEMSPEQTNLLYEIERRLMDLENASGNMTLGSHLKRTFFKKDSIQSETPENMKKFIAYLEKLKKNGEFRSVSEPNTPISKNSVTKPQSLMDTIPAF